MNNRHVLLSLAIFLLISATAWIISCAVNPVTGNREFMLLTESDEVALGKQTDQQIMQTYGVYEDPNLDAYISNIGKEMAKITHRPQLNYSFKVLDTPVVNAFAVPGGYLYFTRGILGHFNNEAELAGVMGHELGHVAARHSAVQYSRSMLAQVGLGVGMIFSENFREYAGLAQFGVSMLFLKFGRDDERQSDDLGVEYATKMGYDATQMANFFETLERMHSGSDAAGLPSWFSTHPNPEDRMVDVRKKTQEWQSKVPETSFVVQRQEYLGKVDGLIYGSDPRQGYVEANTFYHPKMAFSFPIPSQWNVNNTAAQVQMMAPDENAVVIFAGDPSSSPSEAARKFTENAGASILASDAIRINNFQAQQLVSDVPSDQDTIRVLSVFLEKDNQVFVFHGITNRTQFQTYRNTFQAPMQGFARLTDRSKLSVDPKRIRIVEAPRTSSLRSIFDGLNVPASQQEELALLNGMYLDDTVSQNMLIKLFR